MSRVTDDQILEERIKANRLEYPKQSIIFIALVTTFQPVYFSHAINDLSWTRPANLAMYAVVTAFTTYMLTQAYTVMVESEFWRRQRHFAEVSGEFEKQLRRLRLQVSMGYSLFFLNSVFFTVCTCLMAYIFRHADPSASYILSPSITASILWLVAQKNEDSRRNRMRRHK